MSRLLSQSIRTGIPAVLRNGTMSKGLGLTKPNLLPTATLGRAFSSKSHSSESFLSGVNSVYAEQMLENWKVDPTSVHAS